MDSSTLLAKVKSLKQERKFLQGLKIIDGFLDELDPIHKQTWVELLIEKSNLLLILGAVEETENLT